MLALGKLVIGIFTDYNLISIALYTVALLLAKAECVLGATTKKRTFRRRNALTALFLFLSSAVYIGFMSRMFFIERKVKQNGMIYVLLLAFISFCELGFAIAGLLRTKSRGHYVRSIKVINFCIALIAILTTQMAILDMQTGAGTSDIANAYAGIGVGCFIALCALYILLAPRMSVVGRERNRFVLKERDKNKLIDMEKESVRLLLCRSFVYGDYLYAARIAGDFVDGEIVRGKSLFKRMPLIVKILCCILSEILLIVWLIGRGILFFRSACLPQRLQRKMGRNGFETV